MRQKTAPEKLVSALLQTIEPKEIADKELCQTVEILLNLIEQLNSKVMELEAENQRLRDKNNRTNLEGADLKGAKFRNNLGFQDSDRLLDRR